MALIKKPKTKISSLTVRLPPKLRFALELACRRRGLTYSEATMRGLESLVKDEGIDAAFEGQGASGSKLDLAWCADCEGKRTIGIVMFFPELALHAEHAQVALLWRLLPPPKGPVARNLSADLVNALWPSVQACAAGTLPFEELVQKAQELGLAPPEDELPQWGQMRA